MRVSIVIPTFNGGGLLIECISTILSQQTKAVLEIIIIDSESKDGSIEKINELIQKKDIDYKIISIKKKDFRHGKTRNLAIKDSSGEIIILLTQDAIPCGNTWLTNLVTGFESDPQVVGVFGRHKAHKNHPKIIHRDIENHFLIMGQTPVRMIDDFDEYNCNEILRQKLHFFSNNNSAIRKRIWEKIPFPDVTYGEDQTWAKAVIEEGFKIQYCADATVYHSHDYSFIETFHRTKTEVTFFKNYFNYNLSKSLYSSVNGFFRAITYDFRWLTKKRCFSLFDFLKSCKVNLASNLARFYCYLEK